MHGRHKKANHTILAICGSPGVGKSTQSNRLAEWLNMRIRPRTPVIRSDAIRADRFKGEEYSSEQTPVVYKILSSLVIEQIHESMFVDDLFIVEGTFIDKYRDILCDCVGDQANIWFIRLVASEESREERVRKRTKVGPDPFCSGYDTDVMERSTYVPRPSRYWEVTVPAEGTEDETFAVLKECVQQIRGSLPWTGETE